MPREVTDDEGIRWACAEAYAGLKESGAGEDTPRRGGEGGQGSPAEVVCTPSGGAQTVRLRLSEGWESNLSDDELLREIKAGQAEGA